MDINGTPLFNVEKKPLRESQRRFGVGETTVSEDTQSVKKRVLTWYEKHLRHGFGFWLREHTSVIRSMSEPEAHWYSLQTIPVILFVLFLLTAIFTRHSFWLSIGLIICIPLSVMLIVFWLFYRDDEVRRKDWYSTRPYLLSQHGVGSEISALALSRSAEHALPAIRDALTAMSGSKAQIPARLMGVKIGSSHGVGTWLSMEQPVYLVAPTRMGKTTGLVTPIIMEAPGPVVATSSRVDILDETLAFRRDGWVDPTRSESEPDKKPDDPLRFKGGRVWVFDPMDVAAGKYEHDLPWNPLTLCADPVVARSSAEALVGTVGIRGENAMWGRMAVDVVQAFLLAAAVDGRTLSDVYEWAQSPSAAQEAAKVLELHPEVEVARLWTAAVRNLRDNDSKIVGSIMLGVTGAFSTLATPVPRKRLSPDPSAPSFDMDEFLMSTDTVYLLSPLAPVEEGRTSPGGAFTAMFLEQLRDRARRLAAASEYGKLEPYVTFMLDEIANIQPWSGIPQLFTAGTGEGIWPVCVFQSRSQAKKAFSGSEGQMWDSSQKVILGGLADADEASVISKATSQRVEKHLDSSFSSRDGLGALFGGSAMERRERIPGLNESDIRQIPTSMCLLLSRNSPTAAITLIPYWERTWQKQGKGVSHA